MVGEKDDMVSEIIQGRVDMGYMQINMTKTKDCKKCESNVVISIYKKGRRTECDNYRALYILYDPKQLQTIRKNPGKMVWILVKNKEIQNNKNSFKKRKTS